MSFLRFRVTIRLMMLLVGVVACAMWGKRIYQYRSLCLEKAQFYAEREEFCYHERYSSPFLCGQQALGLSENQIREAKAFYWNRWNAKGQICTQLRKKYEGAARYPWRNVSPELSNYDPIE